jgi:hypothetical protein
MKPFLALLLIAITPLLLNAQPRTPTDAALKQALVGVWCNSDDGGKTCWGYDEFRSDGTVKSCALPPGSIRAWTGAARFEVKGTYSCMVVTESSDDTMRPGDRLCAEVLEINAVSQRYRFTDSKEEFLLYRRKSSDMKCPGVGT